MRYSSEDWVVSNNGEKPCLSKSGCFKERAQSVRTGMDLRDHLGLGLILQIKPTLTEGYWQSSPWMTVPSCLSGHYSAADTHTVCDWQHPNNWKERHQLETGSQALTTRRILGWVTGMMLYHPTLDSNFSGRHINQEGPPSLPSISSFSFISTKPFILWTLTDPLLCARH